MRAHHAFYGRYLLIEIERLVFDAGIDFHPALVVLLVRVVAN